MKQTMTALHASLAAAFAVVLAAGLPTAAHADSSTSAPLPRKAAAGAATPKSSGVAVHWYEAGVRREARIDPSYVADFSGASALGQPLKRAAADEKLSALPPGVSPVIREAGGQARALAGGVIVRVSAADAAKARERFAARGLSVQRALDDSGQLWLIDAPAGLPSLQLANQLHESGQFVSATPNWWRERKRK